jgi:hypothetical protein
VQLDVLRRPQFKPDQRLGTDGHPAHPRCHGGRRDDHCGMDRRTADDGCTHG